MNILMVLTVALMSMVVGPIAAKGAQASAQRHHIVRGHHVTPPNPVTRAPIAGTAARAVSPRPTMVHDNRDGLSHEREDCNTGCIGNAR
jgi:hypothetical protein